MSHLHAYYKFQLKHLGGNTYTVEKILKVGNCSHFNSLFTYDKPVTFKKLSPVGLIDDYVIYPLQYGNNPQNRQLLLFETALFLHPYGVVNIGKSQDCILFRISEDDVFEVYITKGYANQTAQMLTLLVDGLLSDEINRLLTKLL